MDADSTDITPLASNLAIDLAATLADRGANSSRALHDLLAATQARAVGLWVAVPNGLLAVGFAAVPDMAAEIQSGFQAATRSVTFQQTTLGIVEAANAGRPIPARVAAPGSLTGSVSWLERFGAISSLSVPIFSIVSNSEKEPETSNGSLMGVMAVATTVDLAEESHPQWQWLVQLAAAIARAASERG